MTVQVVHCTALMVTSHMGDLVVLKAEYDHFMTDGRDVSCSKKISICDKFPKDGSKMS